ncbi:lipase family protein [Blastopirellula retiformator]|uniref:Alpha/beta hydrolase family protein n=1 Tax=Blastopirellula retiformator TaxID=2527970 RepID=A0A5C5VL29_9BACT|nr:hypothetical protein [Blastopirellula retiformator]TWT39314.1 hypothetical protein Enr8_10120 [Blastopirellula retiformator]
MSELKVYTPPTTPEDVVILVHGTFAGREHEEGDAFWQRGSEVWQELESRLPDGISLQEQGRLFHWSGENNERERLKGAKALLEYVAQFEAAGQGYHLVGHSHGGSIIWMALRQASVDGIPLDYLRTWSTVGTPFLRHRTVNPVSIANAINIIAGLFFLSHARQSLQQMFRIMHCAIFDPDHYASTQVELLGRDVNLMDYLMYDHLGWLAMAGVFVMFFVFAQLASFFIGPVIESRRIRQELHAEQCVIQEYGRCWLGIFSPDDEAINGLRTTLHLDITFVGKVTAADRIFVSDYLSFLWIPYYWTVAPTFNYIVRPILNHFVRQYVSKAVQGNNRPSAELCNVSTAPIGDTDVNSIPPLPYFISQRITARANSKSKDIAPKLRALLGQKTLMAGLAAFNAELSGEELVHTSYFNDPDVLNLLTIHMALHRGDRRYLMQMAAYHRQLLEWTRYFREMTGDWQGAETLDRILRDTPAEPITLQRRAAA